VLDVDDLKQINDSFGHAAGDWALQAVAATIREGVRAVDRSIRTGGDEFCVLAPHQTAEEGRALAERLGAAVERAKTPNRPSIAVSIGVVSCPEHGVRADLLLEQADRAMYRAKAADERVAVGAAGDPRAGPAADLAGAEEVSPAPRPPAAEALPG
jgi:diguanylate cyclase (GGDEF)-like protein